MLLGVGVPWSGVGVYYVPLLLEVGVPLLEVTLGFRQDSWSVVFFSPPVSEEPPIPWCLLSHDPEAQTCLAPKEKTYFVTKYH